MSYNNKYIAWGITLVAVGGILLLNRRKQTTPSLINNGMSLDYRTTNKKMPRGYRNNNPLNIRISSERWKGKVLPNTDGEFEQFQDIAYGYRAALATMRTYITKYGLDSVSKIISRWAPAKDNNNTLGYIRDVCNFTGLTPDTVVDRNDKDTLTKMAYGMSLVENGNTEYTRMLGLPNMELINEGWNRL